MARLTLETAEWYGRPQAIRPILAPIAARPARLQVRSGPHRRGGQIIAASDGYDSRSPGEERLFWTGLAGLFAQYFEVWLPDHSYKSWEMRCSYFHLYAVSDKYARDQLVCLHSDPQEPLNQHVGRAKASLHVHVEAEEPRLSFLSKSHIPLRYSDTESMLASMSAFDEALTEAVGILKHEVIDRYPS